MKKTFVALICLLSLVFTFASNGIVVYAQESNDKVEEVFTPSTLKKDTLKAFYETADEERSIETDVDTGAKADSGTKGTVVVDILATGTNIEAGVGAWITSYEITIP